MIDQIIKEYLQSNKRLIIPGMGAFIRRDGMDMVFVPFLKKDDGVLSGLISETLGVDETSSAQIIDEFSDTVKAVVDREGFYSLNGIGKFRRDINGALSFEVSDETAAKVLVSTEHTLAIGNNDAAGTGDLTLFEGEPAVKKTVSAVKPQVPLKEVSKQQVPLQRSEFNKVVAESSVRNDDRTHGVTERDEVQTRKGVSINDLYGNKRAEKNEPPVSTDNVKAAKVGEPRSPHRVQPQEVQPPLPKVQQGSGAAQPQQAVRPAQQPSNPEQRTTRPAQQPVGSEQRTAHLGSEQTQHGSGNAQPQQVSRAAQPQSQPQSQPQPQQPVRPSQSQQPQKPSGLQQAAASGQQQTIRPGQQPSTPEQRTTRPVQQPVARGQQQTQHGNAQPQQASRTAQPQQSARPSQPSPIGTVYGKHWDVPEEQPVRHRQPIRSGTESQHRRSMPGRKPLKKEHNKADRFIIIAILAAVIALASIIYGATTSNKQPLLDDYTLPVNIPAQDSTADTK